jgi:hypothetical protein
MRERGVYAASTHDRSTVLELSMPPVLRQRSDLKVALLRWLMISRSQIFENENA